MGYTIKLPLSMINHVKCVCTRDTTNHVTSNLLTCATSSQSLAPLLSQAHAMAAVAATAPATSVTAATFSPSLPLLSRYQLPRAHRAASTVAFAARRFRGVNPSSDRPAEARSVPAAPPPPPPATTAAAAAASMPSRRSSGASSAGRSCASPPRRRGRRGLPRPPLLRPRRRRGPRRPHLPPLVPALRRRRAPLVARALRRGVGAAGWAVRAWQRRGLGGAGGRRGRSAEEGPQPGWQGGGGRRVVVPGGGSSQPCA